RRNVDILFSNRELCKSQLRINGDRFFFENALKPNERFLGTLLIKEMKIENARRDHSLVSTADFVVYAEVGGQPGISRKFELRRNISFGLRDGKITECIFRADRELTCARIGA